MSIAQVFTRYGTVGQLGRRDRWEYLLCQSKYYCSKKQLPWTPPTCVSLKTRSTGIVPTGTAGHWVRSASSPHESDGTVRLSCMSYAIKFNTMQRYRHNSMRTIRGLLMVYIAAACRGFDASACTPTPRDLLSSHCQLRLHLTWKVANPLYKDVHLVAHGQVACPYDPGTSYWAHWMGTNHRNVCPAYLFPDYTCPSVRARPVW